MKQLPNLYVLRFFLALMVILYHLPNTSQNIGLNYFDNLPIFHKGGVAVFYFFSLSGFLITRNLYGEHQKNGHIKLKKFFKRRMLKLWPVYYLILIIGIFIYQVLIPAMGVQYEIDYSLKKLLLYYFFFLPNVFNELNKVGGILNITWSIGVEEQFYLLFPFVFLIFRKNIVTALSILLILLVTVFIIVPEFYVYQNFYFYFILGGLCAILAEQGKLTLFKNRGFQLLIYMAFLATFFTDILVFKDQRWTHVSQLLISNSLIVALAYFPCVYLDKLKLNYLGEISYGIYMYHMIVMTFYLYAIKTFQLELYFNSALLILLNNLIVIGITIFISHLSYTYFETLFLKKTTTTQPLGSTYKI
ncbi:MAG: acyltransferase [Flavobacterium sp.]|nr:acyltransferase [Flavobacterium sp.]